MVKVLEKGDQPGGWSHDLICDGRGNANGGCGSKLRAFHDDPYYYAGSDTPYGSGPAVVVVCPVCGTANDIEEEHWPSKTRDLKCYNEYLRSLRGEQL